MNWYKACLIVHLLAVFFWLGHMFFWSLVVGPITKRFDPPELGHAIRQMSLRGGGLGWPALFVLAFTGGLMRSYRDLEDLPFRGAFYQPFWTRPGDQALACGLDGSLSIICWS
jgi:uncharacterized membrane protein